MKRFELMLGYLADFADLRPGDVLEVVSCDNGLFVADLVSQSPLSAPEQPPDLGIQVSDATRVADRMG